MGKKRTPEEQNALIKKMTRRWKTVPVPYPPPHGKVKPYFCEHCDGAMTHTGRLPAIADQGSWVHWIGCEVDMDHGVQKVYSTGGYGMGQCCVGCLENYEQWSKEAEESDRIFMAQRELQQAEAKEGG